MRNVVCRLRTGASLKSLTQPVAAKWHAVETTCWLFGSGIAGKSKGISRAPRSRLPTVARWQTGHQDHCLVLEKFFADLSDWRSAHPFPHDQCSFGRDRHGARVLPATSASVLCDGARRARSTVPSPKQPFLPTPAWTQLGFRGYG